MPNKWNKFNANGNECVERNESSFDDGFLLHYMKYLYYKTYVSHSQPHYLHLKMHSSSMRTEKPKKNDFIQCDLFNVVDEGCAREGDG